MIIDLITPSPLRIKRLAGRGEALKREGEVPVPVQADTSLPTFRDSLRALTRGGCTVRTFDHVLGGRRWWPP